MQIQAIKSSRIVKKLLYGKQIIFDFEFVFVVNSLKTNAIFFTFALHRYVNQLMIQFCLDFIYDLKLPRLPDLSQSLSERVWKNSSLLLLLLVTSVENVAASLSSLSQAKLIVSIRILTDY